MSISQEEIEAAYEAWFDSSGLERGEVWGMKAIRAALIAAYTVRKARKQAKRERQRKEKDKQVASEHEKYVLGLKSSLAKIGLTMDDAPDGSNALSWAERKIAEKVFRDIIPNLEKDAQVQDSAKDDGMLTWTDLCKPMKVCAICGYKRCPHCENPEFECTGSNEPGQVGVRSRAKAPEWDGEFYPGDWEMRDGSSAKVETIGDVSKFRFGFAHGNSQAWQPNGRHCNERSLDLIRPWSKAPLTILETSPDEFTGVAG